MNDFLIFGASGLTGNCFVKEAKSEKKTFHLYVRDFLEGEQRSRQTLFNSKAIPKFPDSKTLVICLGYPLLSYVDLIFMKDNLKLPFREVDHDLVVDVAKKAFSQGIQNIAVVSAVGANKNSLSFYLKTKGIMESEIEGIGFKKVVFARPGHLLRQRDSSRMSFSTSFIEFIGRLYGFLLLGPFQKFRNVEARMVANKILESTNSSYPDSLYSIEYNKIIKRS